MRSQTVVRDPEILGGTPVFRGTRVPVQILMDHLEEGDTLDEFLDGFPSVSKEQAIAFSKRQQSVEGLDIAVLVIASRRTRLQDLTPLAPQVLEAVEIVKMGQVTWVGA